MCDLVLIGLGMVDKGLGIVPIGILQVVIQKSSKYIWVEPLWTFENS